MLVLHVGSTDEPVLILKRQKVCGEDITVFSSPYNEHEARLIMLPDSIVVEHTVHLVNTATFGSNERAKAIHFIQCLFKVFNESLSVLEEAYRNGYNAYIEGDFENPYVSSKHARMWELGFRYARRDWPDRMPMLVVNNI